MDRNLKVGWVSNFLGGQKIFFPKKIFFFKSCRKFYNSFKNIVGYGGGQKIYQKKFWQQNFFLAVGKCNYNIILKMLTYSKKCRPTPLPKCWPTRYQKCWPIWRAKMLTYSNIHGRGRSRARSARGARVTHSLHGQIVVWLGCLFWRYSHFKGINRIHR